ncbi:MAG: hypothetical protein KKD38_10135 [Candidatus Delongbacteria bacterium]|nr:hypothetical protein [Candidatus Delongbacteria bacterium]MCG2759774.1 hypothetical protein [Candidatus Delongbacteria bacterium]
MYETTFKQIATNLAKMQEILDKGILTEDCDKLTALQKETSNLFSNTEELFFKKTANEYDGLKMLEKKFDNINSQFNFGEELYDDTVEDTLDSMFPNRHDDDFDEDDMNYDQVFRND